MRKPMLAVAAAIVAALAAPPKPAQAGCWGWCVVPGTSHAFVYGSIYGPHFAYPAYSEYGYGFYGQGLYGQGFYGQSFYGYVPHTYYYGGAYAPYLFVHHAHHVWHRTW